MAEKIKKSDIKKAHRVLKKLPIFVSVILVLLVIAYFVMDAMGISIWSLIYKRDPVEGQVTVHVIDVGQADSILIETADGYMLIDAGENDSEEALRTYLRNMGISTLKYLVLSHAHADHVGGADMVLNEFKVENIVYDNYESCYSSSLVSLINREGANIIDPKTKDKFNMGEAEFTVLFATNDNKDHGDDVNDYSIVLRMDFGESSFVFTGDATTAVESTILDSFNKYELDCDFLKSGHHGSSTSSGKKFISTITPEIVAIPCGVDNKYGHPHDSVMATYSEAGAKVYRTDLSGTLVFVSDGTNITYQDN